MVILTNDGKRFVGRNAKGIVRQMKAMQWNLEDSTKREYMEEVADRVQQMTGVMIPLDVEGFLLGLEKARLIRFEGQGTA